MEQKQICGSAQEMYETVQQTTALGWDVALNEAAVLFTRPDGVSFLWNWVPDLMQFCMVAQQMV